MSLVVGMVTVDCRNPRELARFWSQALDLEVVADYDEFCVGELTG